MSGELRIILLALGLMVILAVYLYSILEKRKQDKKRTADLALGNDPLIHKQNDAEDEAIDVEDEAVEANANANANESANENIISPTQQRDKPPSSTEHSEFRDDEVHQDDEASVSHNALENGQEKVKILRNNIKKYIDSAVGKFSDFAAHKTPQTEDKEEKDLSECQALVLHIRAPSDRKFYGREVMVAAEKVGLEHNDQGLEEGAFERVVVDESGEKVVRFYVANMLEPGIFNWEKLPESRIEGLSVIAQLRDEKQAVDVFEDMVRCARSMTTFLEGSSLLDENHSTLTKQTICHMRERLREEAFKHGIVQE